MRKALSLLFLLAVACGREAPDQNARTMTLPQNPPARRGSGPGGIIPSPLPPPSPPHARAMQSTPQQCAGDGSYEQAIDCFRMSSGFRFTLTDGKQGRAEGEMKRPTPGMERVEMRTSDGAAWVGESKKQGVVWSRGGKHELSPPELTNTVWQRTTMVLDPQKKEGKPQLVNDPGSQQPVGGVETKHWRFTNANSGEINDVWVSAADGHIVRWKAGAVDLEVR